MKRKSLDSSRPKGIDISHHNNKVDFAKVKAAGNEFVFIKATEGGTYQDPNFSENWDGAKQAGLLRGAYHFFRPKTKVSDQVDNFVNTVQAINVGDLYPVIDVEQPELWKGISAKKAADMVIEWITAVERRLGTSCIVYGGYSFIQDILGADARLAQYPLWLAQYRTSEPNTPKPYKTWDIWQYSETGTTDGIVGAVDLNVFNGSSAQLTKLTKTTAVAAPAPQSKPSKGKGKKGKKGTSKLKKSIKRELKKTLKRELKTSLKQELKKLLKRELKTSLKRELKKL
jgi:lysozyme